MTRESKSAEVDLQSAVARFEAWRARRVLGARIPEALWELAAHMAHRYGVSATATALRVSYYSLQERVADLSSTAVLPRTDSPRISFVELPGPSPSRSTDCECVLELERSTGAKLRLQWRGVVPPDFSALSRAFWEERS